MLPFNESCFLVLHSIMVKKKQSTIFTVHSSHSSASALLVFSVQESKKGETLKNNQHPALGNNSLKHSQNTRHHVLPSGDGGKAMGCREKNGMAGIERRKRALVSCGAEQGLDHGKIAAATPEHSLPGVS